MRVAFMRVAFIGTGGAGKSLVTLTPCRLPAHQRVPKLPLHARFGMLRGRRGTVDRARAVA
jgi:hypothetical protein